MLRMVGTGFIATLFVCLFGCVECILKIDLAPSWTGEDFGNVTGRWERRESRQPPYVVPLDFGSTHFRGECTAEQQHRVSQYVFRPDWAGKDYEEEFNAAGFCKIMDNKTLLMVGDSVVGQQFSSLVNLLGATSHVRSVPSKCMLDLLTGNAFNRYWCKVLSGTPLLQKVAQMAANVKREGKAEVCGMISAGAVEPQEEHLEVQACQQFGRGTKLIFRRSNTMKVQEAPACNVKSLVLSYMMLSKSTTYMDSPEWLDSIPESDYIFLSTGSWLQHMEPVKMEKGFNDLAALFARLGKRPEQLIFRSPHQSLGGCDKFTAPLDETVAEGQECKFRQIECTIFDWDKMYWINDIARRSTKKHGFRYHDVYFLSGMRPDAHLTRSVNDCMHFCLPGPPDTFNTLMYNFLKKDLRR